MKTYQEMSDDLARLASQNERLVASLRVARQQIVSLKEDLQRVGDPPNSYATFLQRSDGTTVDVLHNGRRLRVATSSEVDLDALRPGMEVRLNEALAVVEALPRHDAGTLARVAEVLGDHRVLVAVGPDDLRVMRPGGDIGDIPLRPGDSVLVDPKAQLVLEAVERSEITDLVLEQIPDIGFDDIGGLASQIEAIRDAVELPFLQQDLYREYGLRPPKGVLLYGPPGCGKTMIAKAVARELAIRTAERDGEDVQEAVRGASFLNIKGPELLNKYVGETERSIRQVFDRARERAADGRPVVIFFDEMESLFRTRGTGVSSDVETTIVPQLLAEIDGVESLENVIIIGASNREDMIDPAILRPGRLDVKIRVRRPDADASREILALYLDETVPIQGDRLSLIDSTVETIFRRDASTEFLRVTYSDGSAETLYMSDFVSGAMLRNIVDKAKKFAVKDVIAVGSRGVSHAHLQRAIEAEFQENEDLPSGAHPDEWARISGRRGRRIETLESLRAGHHSPDSRHESAGAPE